jgi:hypothetical protein
MVRTSLVWVGVDITKSIGGIEVVHGKFIDGSKEFMEISSFYVGGIVNMLFKAYLG